MLKNEIFHFINFIFVIEGRIFYGKMHNKVFVKQLMTNNYFLQVHRIRYASIAYQDGRLKKGDKIVAINGKPTKGLTYADAVELLKVWQCANFRQIIKITYNQYKYPFEIKIKMTN